MSRASKSFRKAGIKMRRAGRDCYSRHGRLKERYPTRSRAWDDTVFLATLFPERRLLFPYRCPSCQGYHLASPPRPPLIYNLGKA